MTDKAQELYEKKKTSISSKKDVDQKAMISFILSLAPLWSLFVFWIPFVNFLLIIFLLISPILSIVYGIISISEFDDKKHFGQGFAIAGIIISVLQIGSVFLLYFYLVGNYSINGLL